MYGGFSILATAQLDKCKIEYIFKVLCLLDANTCIHTFSQHPHLFAFPQAALLALSSHVHVHLTIASIFTLVYSIFSDTSSEEACANNSEIDV